ncbi:MAG: dipeptidase, partial [Acidobacteria bacterium]|nr:dipeptidase [Acidobacteriota bacterium]NIO59645.1 dipeptidase [Acidobacteriota bacterium]NIQ30387.1 dipeptidase [Acidobacteriota bacterium]NIQ85311.1 dipeptidase [Acidobacteriota bacterium]
MALSSYLKKERNRHLGELKELLAIPSISTDPERAKDVKRAAQWVSKRLKKAGCTKVRVHPTERHPIVYGEWLGAPGQPTILVYGHYDVQPVDPLDLWKSDPFTPTLRDGKLFARGASDDKGQVIVHVNALEAHLKNGGCPVNVKFLIEGEEEIGSPNLDKFIDGNKELLSCDAVVVSDTAMFAKGRPSICYGLRGLAYVEISVTGTDRDLHSGTFGGAVANPANALVTMLDSLKDSRGRIKVKGFYDNVVRMSATERRAFARLPYSDTKFRKSIGAPALHGEFGYSTLERIWARPTLDINGIWSGFTGEGAKTVIPAEANAKVSMRLVPDQTPDEIVRKLTRHLRSVAPKSVKVEVRDLHGGNAWVTPPDRPALQAASRAMQRAFGRKAVFVREGGSIPVVDTFDRKLRVPCVLMGFGLQDDNLHAPN